MRYEIEHSAQEALAATVTISGLPVERTLFMVTDVPLSATVLDLRGVPLTLYTTETGATTVANPLTVGAGTGRIEAWTDAPDYDIVVSGTGVETYTQKVRNSTGAINVKSYGATGDGSTDDTAAIQAAIDAILNTGSLTGDLQGGSIYFPPGLYICAGQLVANRAAGYPDGIRFVGESGAHGAWGGNASMASTIRYTATGSTSFIDARSLSGFQLINMGVQYSSSSFTGILVNFGHDSSGVDNSYTLIQDCSIEASGAFASATALISFDLAILSRVVGGHIGGAAVGIRYSDSGYSNAHSVEGVTFDHCTTAALANCNQTLTVTGCWFEGTSPNSLTRVYIDDRSLGAIAHGLTISNCWMGDGGPAAGEAWVDFGATEARIFSYTGNLMLGGDAAAIGILFEEGGVTLTISGNMFSSVGTAIDLGNFQTGSGIFDGVDICGNWLGPTTGVANVDSGHRNINMMGNAGAGADNNQPSDRVIHSGHMTFTRTGNTAPTVVSNTSNGTTGTVTISGEAGDTCGTITITPGGTGIAAGVLATVTLAESMGFQGFSTVRPKVQFQARNDAAAALAISNTATGDTTFNVRAASAPTTGVPYIWDWFMVGGIQ